MEFRKTLKIDIDRIMDIMHQAQEYLKSRGVDQWQDGYPQPEIILNDIENEESYVAEMDGRVAGTLVISFRGEETYDEIYEGEWLSNDDYCVVHRVAMDINYRGKGLASDMLKYAEQLCKEKNIKSIKIDTHLDNKVMRGLISKNGYKYCGIIYLNNGDKRVGYEKILE